MDTTTVKSYQNRIVNANRKELVIITYEMLLDNVEDGIVAIDNDDDKAFDQAMYKAHGVLRELSDNLNTNYEVSNNLMSIYIYINKRMIEASMRYDKGALLEIKEILNILLVGWQQCEAAEYGNDSVVMNSQKVYAGLTYGKGTLNETMYDNQSSRGYKA